MPGPTIHYAPQRKTGTFTTVFPASSVAGGNSASIDLFRDILVDAGWTLTGSQEAYGIASVPFGLPFIGDGTAVLFKGVLSWQGYVYWLYDPFVDIPPSGPGIIDVIEGADSLETMQNLCNAASGSGWIWSVVDATHIRVDAALGTYPGTAGNGASFTSGFLSTYLVGGKTANGGWLLESQAANGTSKLKFRAWDDGQFFSSMRTEVSTDTTPSNAVGFTLGGALEWKIVANSYQYAILDQTTHSPRFFACAPWTDTVSGYLAYIVPDDGVTLGDPNSWNASVVAQTAYVYLGGTWATGRGHDVYMWACATPDPLIDRGGKPLMYEAMLALPPAGSTETRIAGAIWDTLVTSQGATPGATTEYDGHNWIAIWSQGGGDGGFNHRSTGTVWFAYSDN